MLQTQVNQNARVQLAETAVAAKAQKKLSSGRRHPQRDQQFRKVARLRVEYEGSPNPVISVLSVSVCPAALATPKSITFGTGLSSYMATSTFDGLMSR